jgi:hypothetical protein
MIRRRVPRRPWTIDATEELRLLVVRGVSAAVAASLMKRNISTLRKYARDNGFPFPDRRHVCSIHRKARASDPAQIE